MCALRAHNGIPFLEKVLLKIEKVLIVFSIPDKIFPKTDLLMCALRAHVNRTHEGKWVLVKVCQCGPR